MHTLSGPRRHWISGLLLVTAVSAVALPAQAQWPRVEAGALATERQGNFGYRVQAGFFLGDGPSGLNLSGEWAQDAIVSAYGGTARYRFGGETWGIWPLVGWRGMLGGLMGPEVGLGGELGFGPGTSSLRLEAAPVIGLDGTIGGALRVSSRYRVLTPLELEASYRLENWGTWSQVWGLGAHLVF